MARKDDILRSFLSHELLSADYDITEEEKNYSLAYALASKKPIIYTIGTIVEELEGYTGISDARLYEKLTQILNSRKDDY